MRTTTFLLAAALLPATVLAGGEQIPVGARFAGMGTIGSVTRQFTTMEFADQVEVRTVIGATMQVTK